MLRSFILFFGLFALIGRTYSQEPDSNTVQLPTNEYYYCFAMFEDTIYYTNVFSLEFDSISRFIQVDASWTDYVRNDLDLKLHLPVVNGPYIEFNAIKTDWDMWSTSQPDSVSMLLIDYKLE